VARWHRDIAWSGIVQWIFYWNLRRSHSGIRTSHISNCDWPSSAWCLRYSSPNSQLQQLCWLEGMEADWQMLDKRRLYNVGCGIADWAEWAVVHANYTDRLAALHTNCWRALGQAVHQAWSRHSMLSMGIIHNVVRTPAVGFRLYQLR